MPAARKLDPYGPRPEGIVKLTRAQIVRYALENPLVKAAEQQVEAVHADVLKARFAWVPIITTSAGLSPGANIQCDDVNFVSPTPAAPQTFQYCRPINNGSADIQTIKGYFGQIKDAGVQIRLRADMVVPLYTFGKIKNARAMAKAGEAMAKLGVEQARQETVLRVHQAHATLLLARESMRILREGREVLLQAKDEVVEDLGGDDFDADLTRVDSTRDPDDLIRVELKETEVELRMFEARKVEALALGALWALCGDAAPPGFDVAEQHLGADLTTGTLEDLGHYKQLAKRNRPEAKMADAYVQVRKASEKLARAYFLPDLALLVGASYASSNAADKGMTALYYVDNYNFSRITAALALNWNWDFHNRAFDLKKARAELRKSEFQRDAAVRLLELDVEKAYQDFVEAKHKVELARKASEKNWQLIVSQQQKDTVGGGASKDLLRALAEWFEWRFRYFEALQTQNVALAALSRAVGMPLAREGF